MAFWPWPFLTLKKEAFVEMNFIKKYIFYVRPILRPWFFLAYVFFIPTILFGMFANIYPDIFPILKQYYKKILACQGQILGMALFQVFTSLSIVVFVFFKKSLNDGNLIKFKLKQFLFGIVLAFFITLNNIIFGILGTGKNVSLSFLENLIFPAHILLFFIFFTHGIIPGIVEEIIFRGVMQSYFREIKGANYSIFATSIAFVIPHLLNIMTADLDIFLFHFHIFSWNFIILH